MVAAMEELRAATLKMEEAALEELADPTPWSRSPLSWSLSSCGSPLAMMCLLEVGEVLCVGATDDGEIVGMDCASPDRAPTYPS